MYSGETFFCARFISCKLYRNIYSNEINAKSIKTLSLSLYNMLNIDYKDIFEVIDIGLKELSSNVMLLN